MSGLNAVVDGCLIRGPLSDGTFSSGVATANDVTSWLCLKLASKGGPPDIYNRVSFHSCKATFLSFVAKGGVGMVYRYILGCHCDPSQNSLRAYSRDEFSEPLRRLGKIFDKVEVGRLRPESTCSGFYLTEIRHAVAVHHSAISHHSAVPTNAPRLQFPRGFSRTPSPSRIVDNDAKLLFDISTSSDSDEVAESGKDSDEVSEYAVSIGLSSVLLRRWGNVHSKKSSATKTSCGKDVKVFHEILPEPIYFFQGLANRKYQPRRSRGAAVIPRLVEVLSNHLNALTSYKTYEMPIADHRRVHRAQARRRL